MGKEVDYCKTITDVKKLKEEYFMVCNPKYVKYFGAVPLALIFFSVYYFCEWSTFLSFLSYFAVIVFMLVLAIFLIDFIDLLSTARCPEIDDDTDYVLNEEKTYYSYNKTMYRNICKMSFDRFSKTAWYSWNIMWNFMLNIMCRVCYFIYYFIKVKIGLADPKKIHPNQIYYHMINTSLSFYMDGASPEVVLRNFTTVYNNRTSFQAEKIHIFRAVITVDHKNFTTEKLVIYKTEDLFKKNKPDTLTEQSEIYAFIMYYMKFQAHYQCHTSSSWICYMDDEFFPQRQQAEYAINGTNNLIIKWLTIFIGTAWFEIGWRGANQGIPVYYGKQNQLLKERSQFYCALQAVKNDKEIHSMIDQSIKRLNRKRIANKERPFTDTELVQKKANLWFSVENSVTIHFLDHFIHDRFLTPMIDSEYLKYSDYVGTIFGVRWTDDIVSNLKSHKGPLATAIHTIVKREAPDFIDGFHFTLFQ